MKGSCEVQLVFSNEKSYPTRTCFTIFPHKINLKELLGVNDVAKPVHNSGVRTSCTVDVAF